MVGTTAAGKALMRNIGSPGRPGAGGEPISSAYRNLPQAAVSGRGSDRLTGPKMKLFYMHSAREREKGEFAKNNVHMTSSGRVFHKALLRGQGKGGKKEQGNVPGYELASDLARVSVSDRHQKSADPLLMPSHLSEGRGTIESDQLRTSHNDNVVLEAEEEVVASPPVISHVETIDQPKEE